MTKAHHRQGSGSDRLQELRRFDSLKDPHTILSELRFNKISRATAIKRLESTDAYGLFSCGELLIQEAYDTPVTGDYLNKLLASTDYLRAAIQSRNIANNDRVDSTSARAMLQLENIPIHDLVIQRKLPEKNLAESVHQRTIEIAYSLLKDSWEYTEDRIKSVGVLGELSVLALDQRLAVRKIGSGIYFPCPSTFDQDYRNNHGSVLDRGWDMSVFGDVGFGMRLETKAQVKTRDNRPEGREIKPVQDGISLVFIDPDLRLEHDYNFVPGGIIEDLVLERDYPSDSREHIYASQRLDRREELLLTSLGFDR